MAEETLSTTTATANREQAVMRPARWPLILLTALSLSIGWGIRGNFGHEAGAMIPGALAAMAAVLLSGREDWHRRVAYFAAFGAVGWSFGGSMSYGQVIAYTHSGHSLSVIYGFASLFLIGFLWAAVGGAGTALPAYLSREQLTELFPPLITLFLVWWARDLLEHHLIATHPAFRQNDPLYWYDSDWTAVLLAIVTVGAMALVRRRLDRASALILHMAVGWWIGMLVLVVLLDWRMTPPRSDNWAGCVGMVIGMWVYLQRNGLGGVTHASLVTGFIGGFGFSAAVMLKLVGMTSGLETNWHSIMEQSYGFINGIGVAAAMLLAVARAPQVSDDPSVRRWTDWFAPAFVLLLVTYLNVQKNPERWVEAKAMPQFLYGLAAEHWYNIGYLVLSAAIVWLLIAHTRRPLAAMPSLWLGRGQLLYLAFLWWMVVANFERALVGFTPQRLVTEGVIHLNAVIATLMILLWGRTAARPVVRLEESDARHPTPYPLMRVVQIGLAGMVLSTVAHWGVVRALYGDRFAGQASLHIRFGPHATATKEKPKPGVPHP